MTKKTPIEQALADLDEIKRFAIEQTTAKLEEQVEQKIQALMSEIDLNEGVKVETDDVVVNIDSETGCVSVENKNEESGEGENLGFPLMGDSGEAEVENNDDVEEFEVEDEDSFEISSDEDEEEINEQEQEMQNTQPSTETVDSPEEKIISGIKDLIAQTSGVDDNATSEEEIDIIDDEAQGSQPPVNTQPEVGAPVQQAQPQAQAPVAEDYEMEEEILEIVDDVNEEEEEMIEIELEDEPEMEEMKMMGSSNSVQRTTGKSSGPQNAVDNRSRYHSNYMSESKKENKAHNEAKVAELMKENASLKKTSETQASEIKKFRESFIELRNQLNELQSFNGKLAFMTKLFMNGNFSNEDKMKIAEQFEQTKNLDEAKKVYNKIISESKNETQISDVMNEIKAPHSKVAKHSKHDVLYESHEMKRVKELAFYGNKNNEE